MPDSRQVVLVSAEARPTKNGGTVYNFTDATGVIFSCVKVEIATKAQMFMNKPVIVEFNTTASRGINQNTGQPFPPTNWMNDVREVGMEMAGPLGIGRMESQVPGIPMAAAPRDLQIRRQYAGHSAALLLRYYPEADQTLATWQDLAERLIRWYETGERLKVEPEMDAPMAAGLGASSLDSEEPTPPEDGYDDIPL